MRITLHILDDMFNGINRPFKLFGLSLSFGEQKEAPPAASLLEQMLAELKENRTMLADLIREVAESRSVTESAVTFIAGLKTKIEELAAAGLKNEELEAQLAQLSAELDAQQKNLAAALVTGTVADPAQPPADNGVANAPNVEEPPPPAADVAADAAATEAAVEGAATTTNG